MIVKYFELKKKKINQYRLYLLYGNNKGLISDTINIDLKPKLSKNIYTYDESEIIKNYDNFKEQLLNKSFFEEEKLIIIKRATDKITKIIDEISENKVQDVFVILISDILEKKSKLKNFFEKHKDAVCIPFYEDNNQTLNFLAQNFFKEKKISISQENLNLIINRSRGDRINLKNELMKIESYGEKKKKIELEDIIKLTNLAENYNISELVDNSLLKRKKKVVNILNENNFVNEDCFIILRVLLNKLKRLLRINNEIKSHQNVEKVISSFKPPIFWKEKDIIKEQIKIWNDKNIRNLIIKTQDLEYLIKKNPAVSIQLITNFILEQS